jgi:hypothetical protein
MDNASRESEFPAGSAAEVASAACETLRNFAQRALNTQPEILWNAVVNDVVLPFVKLTDQGSENRWQIDKSSPHSDLLNFQASCTIWESEFLKANPQAKRIDRLDREKEYKLWHATTGEVDSGWQIASIDHEKKQLTLQKNYHQEVRHSKDHSGLVELMPGVPPSFGEKLEAKLAELPAKVRENLHRAGYKIIGASTIADALPGLKNLTPRGWPADTTFDNSDGTHDNVSRRIIAPMRYQPNSVWEPVTRDEVIVHQIGHALDFANGSLSASQDFIAAYNKDMARVANRNDPVIKYLSQRDGVGRQETFATLFGLVLTGPENESQRNFLKRTFPNTIAVVTKQIRDLK